jgi:hypothetical protein
VNVQDVDWLKLRAAILKRVKRKWPYAEPEDREDAVSEALVALFEKWDRSDSAQAVLAEDDPRKVHNYMAQYGERFALSLLGDDHQASTSLVAIVDSDEVASFYSSTISTDRVHAHDDRTDDEREDEMLAKLLDRYGVEQALSGSTTE